MEVFFLVISFLSLVGGFVLGILSRKERLQSGTLLSMMNPKMWLPWKAHEGLTKKGLKLHFLSIELIIIGGVLYLVSQGIPFDLN